MSKILVPAKKRILSYDESLKLTRRMIRDALDRYEGNICVAWSTGKDSTCVLHEVLREYPEIPVYFVDAHEFPETYEYLKWAEKKWKLNLRVIRQHGVLVGGDTYLTFDELTPDVLYRRVYKDFGELGIDKNLLWWTVMKTFPLQELVREKAMFTGMRWNEDIWRGFLNYEERLDDTAILPGNCRIRIHPWLHCSEYDSHYYLTLRGIRRHPLYDKGFRSIGDYYTTNIGDGKSERSGRNQSLEVIIFMAACGYLQSINLARSRGII